MEPSKIKRNYISDIILLIIFSLSFVGVGLFVRYMYIRVPDSPISSVFGYIILGFFVATAVFIDFIYITTLCKKPHLQENERLYFVVKFTCQGFVIFSLTAILINCLSLFDLYTIKSNNISIPISGSFTMLGFGLTIVAILAPLVIKKLNLMPQRNKIRALLGFALPYFYLFLIGLLLTINSVTSLDLVSTQYFSITTTKAFMYSSAQIMYILIFAIDSVVHYVFKDAGLIK